MRLFITFICLLTFSKPLFAKECPFCDKTIENQVIIETDLLRLIADYAPRVKGHLLVIPKRHVVKAHELTAEEWKEIASLIPKIVKVFEKALNTNQYIILEKNGPNAYQTVPHVHFHLLPMHSESWHAIFDVEPPVLCKEEMQNEIDFFKAFFIMEQNDN